SGRRYAGPNLYAQTEPFVWTVELIVMLAMIAFNGVFAGYEIALASVSVARLEALARENRAGAKASLSMKKNMERSLAAIQLGVTLFGAIAAATGGAGAKHQIFPVLTSDFGLSRTLADPIAIAVVVVPLTVVTIVFGELVPKVFSLRNKESVCLRLSPLMRWFTSSVWPAVWILEKIATFLTGWGERRWRLGSQPGGRSEAAELQELRAIAALARTTQLIGAREENIIVSAVRLSQRPVRESMLPAGDISMLDANSTLAEALVAGHLDLHTRFPVTERPGDPQAIVGYANFKDIVACMRLAGHNPSLRSVVRPILSLPEDLPLSAALEQLIREHSHIALVRDRQGTVVGMITLEDILEELVGEIQDEYDRLPTHVKPSGDGWVVGGGVPLARLAEITGLELHTDSGSATPRTLNDWMTAQLGRAVRGGDVVNQGDLSVIVRSVRRKQLHEAQLTRWSR
ncbi:MAG: hemolysin family protein, partial [Thermoguttaceae bacterium]